YDEDHLQVDDIPEPKLQGPHDVIVRVGAAGLCRTALPSLERVCRATLARELPYALGHENAVWVHEVGESVTAVQPGDTVILHPKASCGVCAACRKGEDMHCT